MCGIETGVSAGRLSIIFKGTIWPTYPRPARDISAGQLEYYILQVQSLHTYLAKKTEKILSLLS